MTGLLARWGREATRERRDLIPTGSPARSIERHVVEDADAGLWLLERIAPSRAVRREAVARLLHSLSRSGLAQVVPYEELPDGGHVLREPTGLWMLSRFVPGIPLERPGYLEAPEAGEELARFILDLRSTGVAVPAELGGLSLADYVADLMETLRARAPAVHARASAVAARIAPFLDAEPGMPRTLCHGDLHPLNAVWRGYRIETVIDWEFAGARHEQYDAANALGCMAVESPWAIGWGAAKALVRSLAAGGLPVEGSLLRQAVVAGRFAWLSEWLRAGDREMVALELDLMEILVARPEAPWPA